MPQSCPPSAVLQRMLDDALPGSQGADLELHIAECPACQQVLERLTRPASSAGATLWSGVEAAPDSAGETRVGASPSAAPSPSPSRDPGPLPVIPGYEIVRELGRGGMGVVYLARQSHANRDVAIKMMAAAVGRTEELVRFRLEGESLAMLRHPNIVRVYEVGDVEGRPFFSMEYVSGGNLAAAMAAGPPSPREAASLVETLARAVHAAHQCGVVHRDLKPANILIDAEGSGVSGTTPKITDFGLAKRVGSDSDLTHTGQILGTPSYMAPEQASGGRSVGVQADVYALGAILYEALAGHPPFREESPWATLMKVVHEEPPALSRSRPGLPRDLEVVCLKCLAKRPKDRYSSADALADDLLRWREGRPVDARRAGTARRAWMWTRRHPAYAAMGTLLAASVVAGAVGIGMQWTRAERQLEQSRRRLDLAMRAIDSFHTGASRDVLLKQPELAELRDSLLSTPLEFYRSLQKELEAGDPGDQVNLSQLADTLARLGKLNVDIGREEDARDVYRQAADVNRSLLSRDPRNATARRELADALIKAGEIDARTSRLESARGQIDEALGLFEGLMEGDPGAPDFADGRASCLHFLGDINCDEQQFEESERKYLEAVAIRTRLVAAHPRDEDYLNHLGGTENNLAILYAQWGRYDDARRWFREGLEARELLATRYPKVDEYRRKLGSSLNNLGSFCLNTDRLQDAPPYLRRALVIQEKLVREHPTVTLYQDDLATTYENLSIYEFATGHADRSAAEYARSLAIREKLSVDHPESLNLQARLIEARARLSETYFNDHRYDLAESEARKAVRAAERAAELHGRATEFRRLRAMASRCLGDSLFETGQPLRAMPAYADAIVLLSELAGETTSAEVRDEWALALLSRGEVLASLERFEPAEEDLRRALDLLTELLRGDDGVTRFRIQRARARMSLAKVSLRAPWEAAGADALAGALEEFSRLSEELAEMFHNEPDESIRPMLARVRADRARVLEILGQTDEAIGAWDEAIAIAPPLGRDAWTLGRASTLGGAGRLSEAARVADEVSSSPPERPGMMVSLARLYARLHAISGQESFAGHAISWLQEAERSAWRGDGLRLLVRLDDPSFDVLRGRAAFRAVESDLAFPVEPFAQ